MEYAFLSGGMSGLSRADMSAGREYVGDMLKYDMYVFSPPDHYNEFNPEDYDSEREVRDYDVYKLRHAYIVIVYFNVPESIGTAQELAIAKEHGTPIIGIVPHCYAPDSSHPIHPWLQECCSKLFVDSRDTFNKTKVGGEWKVSPEWEAMMNYITYYYGGGAL